ETLSDDTREKLTQAAVDAAKAIGYTNAGIIELLEDNDENFSFMEMNTRIQVEDAITEMITCIDIVKAQIEIAAGKPLPFKQSGIEFNGFAIECRLNAEDPYNNFQPSSGYIDRLFLPNGGMGLRVETTLYSNYTLPPFYDSMRSEEHTSELQ